MKSIFKPLAFVLAFVFTSLAAMPAHAVNDGLPIRNKFATTNVTTSAYVQLVASTVKGIKGLTVANSGSAPVEIAFGPAGSEVVQMIAPNTSALSPVYYPLAAGYATRISVISLDQTNSTGELEVNLIYN